MHKSYILHIYLPLIGQLIRVTLYSGTQYSLATDLTADQRSNLKFLGKVKSVARLLIYQVPFIILVYPYVKEGPLGPLWHQGLGITSIFAQL